MVKIRLARYGAKNQPKYRIVSAEEKFKRDGRFIEVLGFYDPTKNPSVVKVNRDRLNYWLSVGAQPTDTVRRLVAKA